LNWSNFYVQNPQAIPNFATGVVSSPNVAFNGLGGAASFSSSSPFTWDSAYFTSVYASQDQLTVQFFSHGSQVFSSAYTIFHDTPTLVALTFPGVDSIQLSTSDGAVFAMDNMTITIPEPSTCLLALAAGLAFIAQRKRPGNRSQ
jgi:hypothetical protein